LYCFCTADACFAGFSRLGGIIRGGLSAAQSTLAELRTMSQAQQGLEQQATESIQRLERMLAGSQSKGIAGENIVEIMFSKLPTEWQVRDFSVGNKTVEFGIRLPNDLVLPIDSKWAASNLVEEFVKADDVKEKQRINEGGTGLVKVLCGARFGEVLGVHAFGDASTTALYPVLTICVSGFDFARAAHVKTVGRHWSRCGCDRHFLALISRSNFGQDSTLP
jgi:hypothetical protein